MNIETKSLPTDFGENGVAIVCRGEGAGAPARNARIIRAFQKEIGNLPVRIYSYGQGLAGLARCGLPVEDLGLGHDPIPWDLMVALGHRLRSTRPRLTIVIGEFAAVPACALLGVRCVFVADWLPKASLLPALALKHAHEIVILDSPGSWDAPPYVAGKVHFVGSVVREFGACPAEKPAAQPGYHIAALHDADIPGQMLAGEFFGMVSEACGLVHRKLGIGQLDWHDRTDPPTFRPSAAGAEFEIRESAGDLLRPDVVLVTNTRLNVLECEALGLRSISLALAGSQVDDERISRVRSNLALKPAGLRREELADHICSILKDKRRPQPQVGLMPARVRATVARLVAASR